MKGAPSRKNTHLLPVAQSTVRVDKSTYFFIDGGKDSRYALSPTRHQSRVGGKLNETVRIHAEYGRTPAAFKAYFICGEETMPKQYLLSRTSAVAF